MNTPGAHPPLRFPRIGRAELGIIHSLQLDASQVDRFLGPLEHIARSVRDGPAHAMFAIELGGSLIGFFVLHPDARDASCWWVGWLALDRRWQGFGHGRTAMAQIQAILRRTAACRVLRLLVAPDNKAAIRLYQAAGFRPVGASPEGELILEAAVCARVGPAPIAALVRRGLVRRGSRAKVGRLRGSAGPHAARMIGVTRGPPPGASRCLPGSRAAHSGA